MNFRKNEKGDAELLGTAIIAIVVLLIIGLYLVTAPQYRVWKMDKEGQAQLAEAEWTKKIKVEEAKADLESAKLEKEAMIVRAQGTAESNKIVAGSLDRMYIDYLLASNFP